MLAGTLKKHRFQKEAALTTRRGPMNDLQQDIALVERIAAKDESALRELYAVYGQRLYAYALRLTEDPAQAEDVLQDTLVTVWHSAKKFRGEGRLLAWLLGIVHHTALKFLRHRPNSISEEMENSLPATDLLPEEQIQINEQSEWVRRGLHSLSSDHRVVLELVFYQGLSLEEIAQVCGCPVGTVKSRLSYARRQLRGVLSRTEKAR